MSELTISLNFIIGVTAILILLVIIKLWDDMYLETQLIQKWMGRMFIIKLFDNPFILLALYGLFAGICFVTFGFGGGLIIIVIESIFKKATSTILLKNRLKKALAKNRYDTNFRHNDALFDKITAGKRAQFRYLIDHPKTALIIATMRDDTVAKIKNSEAETIMTCLYKANSTEESEKYRNYFSSYTPEEKKFVAFLAYPYSKEGEKEVEKELKAIKKQRSATSPF